MKLFLSMLYCIIIFSSTLFAENKTTSAGVVYGTVTYLHGEPIENVAVTLTNTKTKTTFNVITLSDGTFRFEVPPATYIITFYHEKYIIYPNLPTNLITVKSGDNNDFSITMYLSERLKGDFGDEYASEEVVVNGKKPIVKKDNTSGGKDKDSGKSGTDKTDKRTTKTDKTTDSTSKSDTYTDTKRDPSGKTSDSTSKPSDSDMSVDTSRIPKAGEHDDNEEFPAFLTFFERFNTTSVELNSLKKDIEGRILISVLDANGHPIKDAKLDVNGRSYYSANDGDILLFPSDIGVKGTKKVKAVVSSNSQEKTVELTANTAVRQQVQFDLVRTELTKVPVDIVFTMDTTGSMGDEIDILRDTIYSIYTRINKLENTSISLRFGMVLFRDKGDSYVTQQFPLTDDIEKFQEYLFNVRSGGGGDTPEDLIAGLDETVNNMNWKKDAVKLSFIITDAPGHMYDTDRFRTILNNARTNNIKLFAVGASGLTTEGEIHLRITAQTTKGSFIFLTYGETGESSGTDDGKVSHHTGTNFTSRNLDDIVVDNVARQIRYLVPASALTALQQKYDFKGEEERITIRTDNAFQQIVRQLKSKLNYKTTVLVLPPDCDVPSLREMSVFVSTFLEKSIVDNKFMSVVDRSKLDKVMQEIQLKLMGLTEGEDFSKLAHADTILASRLYYLGDSKVLFLRLISTDTSEVLAASMVRI